MNLQTIQFSTIVAAVRSCPRRDSTVLDIFYYLHRGYDFDFYLIEATDAAPARRVRRSA